MSFGIYSIMVAFHIIISTYGHLKHRQIANCKKHPLKSTGSVCIENTGGALAAMISSTGSICSCGKTGSAIIVLTNDFVPISVWWPYVPHWDEEDKYK